MQNNLPKAGWYIRYNGNINQFDLVLNYLNNEYGVNFKGGATTYGVAENGIPLWQPIDYHHIFGGNAVELTIDQFLELSKPSIEKSETVWTNKKVCQLIDELLPFTEATVGGALYGVDKLYVERFKINHGLLSENEEKSGHETSNLVRAQNRLEYELPTLSKKEVCTLFDDFQKAYGTNPNLVMEFKEKKGLLYKAAPGDFGTGEADFGGGPTMSCEGGGAPIESKHDQDHFNNMIREATKRGYLYNYYQILEDGIFYGVEKSTKNNAFDQPDMTFTALNKNGVWIEDMK